MIERIAPEENTAEMVYAEQYDLRAIYHPVPPSKATEQDTLIYNVDDGFAWVRVVEGAAPWTTTNATAIGAEIEARKAGLDPRAVCYRSNRR